MDKDSEEEKEGLVHGGEVDAGVERDEEHQLDEEAGVDEDVGVAGAEPHEDAGRGGVLGRVDNTLRHDIMTEAERGHSISICYLMASYLRLIPAKGLTAGPGKVRWSVNDKCLLSLDYLICHLGHCQMAPAGAGLERPGSRHCLMRCLLQC